MTLAFFSGLSSALICINLGIVSLSFTSAWYDMPEYLFVWWFCRPSTRGRPCLFSHMWKKLGECRCDRYVANIAYRFFLAASCATSCGACIDRIIKKLY